MEAIDRNLAIIRPKKPYLDWVRSLPNPDKDITLEELRLDCSTFLIPAEDSPQEGTVFLEKHFREIFEYELSSWDLESKNWPSSFTLQMFRDWFDLEIHTLVIDLVEEEPEE